MNKVSNQNKILSLLSFVISVIYSIKENDTLILLNTITFHGKGKTE